MSAPNGKDAPTRPTVAKKKSNPLGFLTKISPVTYVYIFVVGVVIYFVMKYWKIAKWLGLAAALVAAFPFLADGLAAIVGGIGGALLFAVQAFRGLISSGESDEVAADVAENAKEEINETATNSPDPTVVNAVATQKAEELEDFSFVTATEGYDFQSFEDEELEDITGEETGFGAKHAEKYPATNLSSLSKRLDRVRVFVIKRGGAHTR